jgi:hypothetical protein
VGVAGKVGHFFGLGDDEFDESKHPRDENGKFAAGGGGGEAPKSAYDKALEDGAKYVKADDDRKKRVQDYADIGYYRMNDYFKYGKDLLAENYGKASADKTEAEALALKKDVENGPHFAGTVLRGGTMDKKSLEQMKPGATVTANSFWSTSVSQDIAESFVAQRDNADKHTDVSVAGGAWTKKSDSKAPFIFHIDQKAGLAIGKASSDEEDGEKEVLIPPGVKFEVTKVEKKAWIGPSGNPSTRAEDQYAHVYLRQL